MKKLFFVFLLFMCFQLPAKNMKTLSTVNADYVSYSSYSLTFNNSNEYSIRCWLFKKWIVKKLREVSDNEELIQDTANSLKELCEIAEDWDLL